MSFPDYTKYPAPQTGHHVQAFDPFAVYRPRKHFEKHETHKHHKDDKLPPINQNIPAGMRVAKQADYYNPQKALTPQPRPEKSHMQYPPTPNISKVSKQQDTIPDHMRASYSHPEQFKKRGIFDDFKSSEEYRRFLENASTAFNEDLLFPERRRAEQHMLEEQERKIQQLLHQEEQRQIAERNRAREELLSIKEIRHAPQSEVPNHNMHQLQKHQDEGIYYKEHGHKRDFGEMYDDYPPHNYANAPMQAQSEKMPEFEKNAYIGQGYYKYHNKNLETNVDKLWEPRGHRWEYERIYQENGGPLKVNKIQHVKDVPKFEVLEEKIRNLQEMKKKYIDIVRQTYQDGQGVDDLKKKAMKFKELDRKELMGEFENVDSYLSYKNLMQKRILNSLDNERKARLHQMMEEERYFGKKD